METEILKDIKEYKYTHFAGLDTKKVVALFLSVVLVASGVYVADLFYLDKNIMLTLISFLGIIPLLFGFIEIEGNSLRKSIWLLRKHIKFQTTQYTKQNTFIPPKEKKKKEKKGEKNHGKRKI